MTRRRGLATAAISAALLVFTAFWLPAGSLSLKPVSSPAVSELQTESDVVPLSDALVAASVAPYEGDRDDLEGVSSTTDGNSATRTDALDAVADGDGTEVLGSSDAGSGVVAAAGEGSDTAATTSTTRTSTSATSGSATSAPGDASSSQGVRLRIPSLGVDALVVELGFNAEGQLEVPNSAYTVGWYSISSTPGAAGNALFGGHLNWAGARGVFDRLDELSDGDLIYIVQNGQELAYEVSGTRAVTADTPLQQVLQAPAPGSTITLFTCGGSFNRSAGEYDHRFVVNAVRVANGAG